VPVAYPDRAVIPGYLAVTDGQPTMPDDLRLYRSSRSRRRSSKQSVAGWSPAGRASMLAHRRRCQARRSRSCKRRRNRTNQTTKMMTATTATTAYPYGVECPPPPVPKATGTPANVM
jgi:hypothetical protein